MDCYFLFTTYLFYFPSILESRNGKAESFINNDSRDSNYIRSMNILMVCLGNICRSPLADGLLRHKVERDGITALVDSAGTANYHTGGPPDERMTETAMGNGINISSLRARQFEVSDYDTFDLIYVMDKSNYHNVTRLARDENDIKKVKLILDELGHSNNIQEVPDPYYGGQAGFDHVFELLDRATDVIIEKLKNG